MLIMTYTVHLMVVWLLKSGNKGKSNTVKTILIELRYHSEPGTYEPYSGLIDGINDIVGRIAQRFSLDIMSVSHAIESRPQNYTSITCTAVCLLNEFPREHIGKTLKEENNLPNANLYCFLEGGKEGGKLSVRAGKIHYN
jgi:hypothetical protein